MTACAMKAFHMIQSVNYDPANTIKVSSHFLSVLGSWLCYCGAFINNGDLCYSFTYIKLLGHLYFTFTYFYIKLLGEIVVHLSISVIW